MTLIKLLQPAVYCMDFPVQRYLLTLLSKQTKMIVSLDSNNTETFIRFEDGLVENQIYMFAVTAINTIGNVTSDKMSFCELKHNHNC